MHNILYCIGSGGINLSLLCQITLALHNACAKVGANVMHCETVNCISLHFLIFSRLVIEAPVEIETDAQAFFCRPWWWFTLLCPGRNKATNKLYTRTQVFLANSNSLIAQDLHKLPSLANAFSTPTRSCAYAHCSFAGCAVGAYIQAQARNINLHAPEMAFRVYADAKIWVYQDKRRRRLAPHLYGNVSLVPDRLMMQDENETRICMVDGATTSMSTRLRTHADELVSRFDYARHRVDTL